MRGRFDSIYTYQFIRAAVCIPSLRVADPEFNVERTLALARQASEANVAVALFPELGISAYSNEDLFHQDALLDACKAAVERLRASPVRASSNSSKPGLCPTIITVSASSSICDTISSKRAALAS